MNAFWSKVEKTDSCWNWTGAVSRGYGQFKTRDGARPAHRVSYQMLVGPIPDGLQLDHICRNRRCVNPAHLEAVTPRVNTLRGLTVTGNNARKTHCVHGHEFNAANTILRPKRNGRECRTCKLDWARRAAA